MEPRSKKTWVTTIFETDDWPELPDAKTEEESMFLSKLELVGELRPCCANEGE